jgi:hypothetical protein
MHRAQLGGVGSLLAKLLSLFDLAQAQLYGEWEIFGGGYVTLKILNLRILVSLEGELQNEY